MIPKDKLTICQIKDLLTDIKEGKFEVEYEAPDGCDLRNGPDGTPYIVIRHVEDSVRYSPLPGSCTVKVKDYKFYIDGGFDADWESNFFYDLSPTYTYRNGRKTTDEKIWDKVKFALDKSSKIIDPPYYECPALIYRLANHLRDDIEGIWIDDYEALFEK